MNQTTTQTKTNQTNQQPDNPTKEVEGKVVEKTSGEELDTVATASISTGIGCVNVCCGPNCYCFPTLLASAIGIVLYAIWKDEKPKTAKTILTVTLITAGVALGLMLLFFALGITASIVDAIKYGY